VWGGGWETSVKPPCASFVSTSHAKLTGMAWEWPGWLHAVCGQSEQGLWQHVVC
jgi:hypothetical protein